LVFADLSEDALADAGLVDFDLVDFDLELRLGFALVFAAVAKVAESSLWIWLRAGDPARADSV
jgi:hypothetical protein